LKKVISEHWQKLNVELIKCTRCPRLVAWREQVAREKRRAYHNWDYWGKPVPGFGDRQGEILAVGLAPGAHGSNRTGRMFTGDASGDFLYPALHIAGFANQPDSTSRDDGLELRNMFITSLCRCAPPANKPTSEEIDNCLPFLLQESALLPALKCIVALGRVAFERILRLYRLDGHDIPRYKFIHAEKYKLPGELPWLIASYHPSRQNTQTGLLTQTMFAEVWEAANLLSHDICSETLSKYDN
jgi:uracil-DNA glycosylase family 4